MKIGGGVSVEFCLLHHGNSSYMYRDRRRNTHFWVWGIKEYTPKGRGYESKLVWVKFGSDRRYWYRFSVAKEGNDVSARSRPVLKSLDILIYPLTSNEPNPMRYFGDLDFFFRIFAFSDVPVFCTCV